MRGTAAEAATYEGEVDQRLAALKGRPADATLPAGTAPKPRMSVEEAVALIKDHFESVERGDPEALALKTELDRLTRRQNAENDERAKLLARGTHLLHGLDLDDLRVRVAMLEQGSFEQVKARCEAIKHAAAEPALLPDGTLPKNKLTCDGRDNERYAQGLHLSALRSFRLLVLGPDRGTR